MKILSDMYTFCNFHVNDLNVSLSHYGDNTICFTVNTLKGKNIYKKTSEDGEIVNELNSNQMEQLYKVMNQFYDVANTFFTFTENAVLKPKTNGV